MKTTKEECEEWLAHDRKMHKTPGWIDVNVIERRAWVDALALHILVETLEDVADAASAAAERLSVANQPTAAGVMRGEVTGLRKLAAAARGEL